MLWFDAEAGRGNSARKQKGTFMADNPLAGGEKFKLDGANLFREETYTDLHSGTIVKLTPVRADGSDDPARTAVFVAKTQIYSQMGLIPLEGEIEAANLAEAVEKFPATVELALAELAQRIEQRQREASRQIVTPDQLMGGRGPAGGGGNLII